MENCAHVVLFSSYNLSHSHVLSTSDIFCFFIHFLHTLCTVSTHAIASSNIKSNFYIFMSATFVFLSQHGFIVSFFYPYTAYLLAIIFRFFLRPADFTRFFPHEFLQCVAFRFFKCFISNIHEVHFFFISHYIILRIFFAVHTILHIISLYRYHSTSVFIAFKLINPDTLYMDTLTFVHRQLKRYVYIVFVHLYITTLLCSSTFYSNQRHLKLQGGGGGLPYPCPSQPLRTIQWSETHRNLA